jgi:hypothetical protein
VTAGGVPGEPFWRNAMTRTTLALATLFASAAADGVEPAKNDALLKQKANLWNKIHEQKKTDRVRFRRPGHGGSCFDTKRGRIILFGSDTHGRDWTNSPLFFDPVKLEWTRAYPDDPKGTYAVSDNGLPVAGEKGDHPWATHTFGAVEYDPKRDEMIVACGPFHMVPGRFTNALQHLWDKVKKHPTWTCRLKDGAWAALPCSPVHFFPYCAAFDTDRNVVIGHNPRGVYELGGEPRKWAHVVRGGKFGWHTNATYDAKHKALIVFGTNKNANDVVVYRVADKSYKMMPTPGKRPPKDQHNPMAFHLGIGQIVVLVDHVLERRGRRVTKEQTETWLYDLGRDAWTQIETATLPFACGMNYNMEYDPGHDVLLLVTGGHRRPTAVWALKLSAESGEQGTRAVE